MNWENGKKLGMILLHEKLDCLGEKKRREKSVKWGRSLSMAGGGNSAIYTGRWSVQNTRDFLEGYSNLDQIMGSCLWAVTVCWA